MAGKLLVTTNRITQFFQILQKVPRFSKALALSRFDILQELLTVYWSGETEDPFIRFSYDCCAACSSDATDGDARGVLRGKKYRDDRRKS